MIKEIYTKHPRRTPLLDGLARIVGNLHLAIDEATIQKLSHTTSPEKGTRPLARVSPSDKEQVQQIVQLAAAHRVPLYPISTGKNWGYGDACAPQAGSLILDLSRMDRIIEVNEKLAYAVIEPGVTQGQLAAYLKQHKIPLMMDCTGAGPDASWIGNTMERGFGHSPNGDRYANSCNYEVILADGSCISTGFGSYPQAQAQHVYKWGVGPTMDGLFTQSNMGIVTRMTVWLMPQPESIEYFFITLKSDEAVGALMETLSQLRLQGVIRSTIHCFNQQRLLACRTQYPWKQADGRQALEVEHPEMFKKMCSSYGLPAWAVTGMLSGTKAQVRAERAAIKKALQQVPALDKFVTMNEKRFRWIQRMIGLLERILPQHHLIHALAGVRLSMDVLAGFPSQETVKGANWRARETSSSSASNPVHKSTGLLWLSPVFPATEEAVEKFMVYARPIFHRYGFEFQVTLSCTTERAISAIMSICFDKSNPDECTRAKTCSEELLDVLLPEGYIPYRGSPQVLERIREYAPALWDAASKVKQSLDPHGLIAPGRYVGLEKSTKRGALDHGYERIS